MFFSRRPQTRLVLHVVICVKSTLEMQCKSELQGRLHVIIIMSVADDPTNGRTS